MIKYNSNTINDWYFDESDIIKVYRNNSVCYYKITSGGAPEPQYRTISGETYCSGSTGYDKYVDIYSQVSYDGGSTWETTATTPTLVEANSPDCGYVRNYFKFVAKETCTFKFTSHADVSTNTVDYSLDSGATWTTLANGVYSPSVSSGNVIMWKSTTLQIRANAGCGTFSSTGNFDVEGNVMSLYYGDNFEGETSLSGKDYAFMNLFSGCTTVINADKLVLPATTLSKQCYCNMYNRAINLAKPPSLSAATTLAVGCCQNMYYNSPNNTSFSVAESYFLPATTLVQDCYRQMFYGCSNFNKITCLATSGINTNNSTNNWLTNTSSSGTFTRTAGVSWPTSNNGRKSWTLVNYGG